MEDISTSEARPVPDATRVLIDLSNREVVDDLGGKVGKVVDVLFDDRIMTPTWAVVHVGVLGADHFVPFARSYRSQDGSLVIPYPRGFVKHSPKATKDHILSTSLEDDVRRYYGLAA